VPTNASVDRFPWCAWSTSFTFCEHGCADGTNDERSDLLPGDARMHLVDQLWDAVVYRKDHSRDTV
jgi:hypothetical protein